MQRKFSTGTDDSGKRSSEKMCLHLFENSHKSTNTVVTHKTYKTDEAGKQGQLGSQTILTTILKQSLVYTRTICCPATSCSFGIHVDCISATYRVAQKTRPPYLNLIANILKIPWLNCVEIGELLQYYMLNTVINFLFKNCIALWRHLAKTQLLCDAQIYLYSVNKRQNLARVEKSTSSCGKLFKGGTTRREKKW